MARKLADKLSAKTLVFGSLLVVFTVLTAGIARDYFARNNTSVPSQDSSSPISDSSGTESLGTTTIAPNNGPTSAPVVPEYLVSIDSNSRSVEANCDDPVNLTAPSTDLAAIVAASTAGSCFLLAPGEYDFGDVVPKDQMTFIGASTTTVLVNGWGRENAFHGTAHDVTIARMTLQNFDGDGGEKPQEQSPIRGTSALWKSDRGQLAVDWLVEEVFSRDNLASGIFVGDHFTVRGSRFHNNGVTGVGGDEFVGGLFEHNIIDLNGQERATGVLSNGGGIKFTQAGTPEHPVVIRENEISENLSIGVWCDIGCDGVEISDNFIHDHFSQAIMIELSRNALIERNRIERSNEWTNFTKDWNAGSITIGESSDIVVRGNQIDTAESGIVLRQTLRPARPGENFLDNYDLVILLLERVDVLDNTLINVANTGVSIGTTGAPIIDPASLNFAGNRYEMSPGIRLWSADGSAGSLSEWQSSGNDVTTGTPMPLLPIPDLDRFDAPVTQEDRGRQSTDEVALPLRVNAGGPEFVDPDGHTWMEDLFFIGGDSAHHANPAGIANTSTDQLFESERWGAFVYQVPIANGTYQLVLHHAEVFQDCQTTGCRQFGIVVEGQTVEESLDIYELSGGYSAHLVSLDVVVEDGFLSIELVPSIQNPQLSGLEILIKDDVN